MRAHPLQMGAIVSALQIKEHHLSPPLLTKKKQHTPGSKRLFHRNVSVAKMEKNILKRGERENEDCTRSTA